jgi:hypothetical protein
MSTYIDPIANCFWLMLKWGELVDTIISTVQCVGFMRVMVCWDFTSVYWDVSLAKNISFTIWLVNI